MAKLVEDLLALIRREKEAEKAAAGTFVSRPVLNNAEWAAWAADAGVPNPFPAAQLHVTIMHSVAVIQMIPDDCPVVIDAKRGAFALLGAAEDYFALAFQNWQLQDRWYQYVENGATPTWPTFRPHMSLSQDAAGFELDLAKLATAPEYIVLGAEVSVPLQTATSDDEDPEGVDADEDGDYDADANPLIIVIQVEQAAKALERTDISPLDRAALYDITKSRPVTANVLKRLGAVVVDIEKGAKPKADRPRIAVETKKRGYERDVVVTMTQPMRDVLKAKVVSEVLKSADEEQRLMYAISNVYSIAGETVVDSEGEGFTTQAMEEFIADVLKREKSSTWEHQGEAANVVVQGLVLSHELQKALGIDLGFECLVTATHFPEEDEWAKAKAGPWEQSIAGRFWCWEEGE